jgi:hypothetical protein
MPRAIGGKWGGVGRIQKILGVKAFRKLERLVTVLEGKKEHSKGFFGKYGLYAVSTIK